MKIFIDWLKKAITKIEHDNELYVGNQFSTKFDIYFFNVGTDTDWFPTLTQLAPTGREAGPFSADSDSFTTTTIDNVTYLTVTFTMGTGYAFIKGVSSFFLYENRITTPHPTKSVIGKFIVTLNKSDNGYFLDDPEFNPKVKEYVDKYSQLRFGGEASTSVIEALETNQGVWLATDTGYYWYWDYDNNEYVRGNLFQAVSVADNGISTAKIQDGAVTENKLANAVKNKINNSVQKGENNPSAASNVHTIISNSNSQEEDVDSSYGSHVDLALDEAEVEHSYYSGGTTKYSGIKFDEYHDNTTNEDYPRAVIETEYSESATPENSKITVLKDLIELLSGGKIELTSKTGVDITSGDDTNQVEGDINIESKYGDIKIKADSAHTIIIRGCVDFYDDIWAHNSYITGQDIFAERSLYENNKRVATKEYVQQREAYLQAQIDASGLTPSDIADNLTTNDSTKVLSAAQGVVLKGFIDNINTLLQCDDTTLDEIQEIVDYIKNNKSLIDGITTSKVNVSDIVNALTSTATNKPLSAAQGKALKDTLDSVQASISALTTNKQDKIDSSHKLDADLVAENSSRVFVTPTQKQQIGTNASDISSLDGRVTNLENNPTSNVSGTNDGTNWTTITIGNDTYAIPSGSSGGSGSGETLKIIKLSAVWVDEVYIGMRGTEFETILSQLSQAMGTTITEDMIPTLWANASDYEKLSVVYYLTLGKLFASWGANDVLAFTPTQVEVDGTTVVTSIALSYLNSSNQITTISTNQDLEQSGATISITTIGSGNGGSSASSGALYEIKTSDIAFYDANGNQETSDVLDNLRITMSEGQFEALKVKMGLPSSATINDLLTQVNAKFTETSASASNTAYQALVALSGYCQFWSTDNNAIFEFALMTFGYGLQALGGNKQYSWFTIVDGNDTPMGISATWTLTQYGTSGGSSSSESYYKIVLEDGSMELNCIIYKDDLATMLTAINTQMGTSLATPTDLINLYDTMKGNSNYTATLVGLFTALGGYSCDSNLNCVVVISNISKYKITGWGDNGLEYTTNGSHLVFSSSETYYIGFTSSSTLTITEQNNQKI